MEELVQHTQKPPVATQQLDHQLIRKQRKSIRVAMLLALTLGGLGAHKFYQGRIGEGVFYLLFSWTMVPSMFAIIDVFFLPSQIRISNHAAELNALKATSPANAQTIGDMFEQQIDYHHLEIVLKIIFGILFAWLVYVSAAKLGDMVKLHDLQQEISEFAILPK